MRSGKRNFLVVKCGGKGYEVGNIGFKVLTWAKGWDWVDGWEESLR